ncbi:MAG TPA: hypothetical protein VLH81_06035, partial [Desulfobacterales bacterium]|nr:hypothetical protein [Desulfobacterales bacterium]
MTRVRLVLIAAIVLAMTACPNPPLDTGFPQNTIAFTLDEVDYQYSASTGLSTHGWGRGEGWGGPPPSYYILTASASEADAIAGHNTIELYFQDYDGSWSLTAWYYDAAGYDMSFDLGTADFTLLQGIVRNLDEEGEQMQGGFLGP